MQLDQVALGSRSIFSFSVSFTPASTAAATSANQSITVPDGTPALLGTDMILVAGPPAGNALALGPAKPNNATTISVSFINPTAGALTHAAGTFHFLVIRH